jgi:pyruvate ferredoxin oxidoreductase delta subunit
MSVSTQDPKLTHDRVPGAAYNVDDYDDWTSEQYPRGAKCLSEGNSVEYITGGWRTLRPVWTAENCRDCMLCWVNCPDSSILVKDGKMTGIDYDHCKGCGICAVECKFEALDMQNETDFDTMGGE